MAIIKNNQASTPTPFTIVLNSPFHNQQKNLALLSLMKPNLMKLKKAYKLNLIKLYFSTPAI